MNRCGIAMVIAALILASGCASMKAVSLDRSFWQERERRVGVVLEVFPEPDLDVHVTTTFAGFGRSFAITEDYMYGDYAMLRNETRGLRRSLGSSNARGFEGVRDLFVDGLRERGFDAFPVEQRVDARSLPRFAGDGGFVHAPRDYRDIGAALGADVLVVIGLTRHGAVCRYLDFSGYGVDVFAEPSAQMVETSTNRVLWRTGAADVSLSRSVGASCGVPAHAPTILEALHGLLGEAGQALAERFFAGNPAASP